MSRLVIGAHAVRAAVQQRPQDVEHLYLSRDLLRSGTVAAIAGLARKAGLHYRESSTEQLARLADGQSHQGAVAELKDFRYLSLDELLDGVPQGVPGGEAGLLLVLDGIEDPHNLGAIIRCADALGAHGLVIPKDRAAGVTPAVGRASAGALEAARIAQVVNLSRAIDEIKKRGYWVAAADQEAKQPIWEADLTGPIALVIGAEGSGVRPLVRRHCDLQLGVPLGGSVGSLNASVAAGVMLYEAKRQRATPPTGRR